jgi:hypothetical protein
MSKTSTAVQIAKIQTDIQYIKADIASIRSDVTDIKSNYLTKDDFALQFNPIQRAVIGAIALIVTAVLGAGVMFIIKKP